MANELELDFSELSSTASDNAAAMKDILNPAARKPLTLNLEINADTTEGYSWGILQDFLDTHDAGNTDTNALRWSFISMIGIIKGRDVWLDFGGEPLYPNMYTMIVGDPGSGKSTAIKKAKDLLDELGYPSLTPEMIDPSKLGYYCKREYKEGRIAAMPIEETASPIQSSAKAAFLKKFDTQADTVMAIEIADRHTDKQFIARGRLDNEDHDALSVVSGEYSGVFPPGSNWFTSKALIDLYDAHDHPFYEIQEGSILNHPIMNVLGGITPSGLAGTFKSSDLSTGLLTRMMLVHSKPVEKSNPFNQRHDYKSSTELLIQLRKVYDFKGQLTISKEAEKIYSLIDMSQLNSKYDIRLEFYYNRRMLHLTKVAMILALLNGREEISKSDMITANTLLLYTEFDMPRTLTAFANTAQIKIRNAIIDYLEKNMANSAGITSQDIHESISAKLGINKEAEVTKQMQRLVSSGMVIVLQQMESNNYILNKPRNTDIVEAVALKVAIVEAIPEWSIANYAMQDEEDDLSNIEL